ncbi:single-stranded DNA-binding protein [Clostridium sp.]|uniref:single-stranded DNA-binding protein n=1 Tax=Clostridium sp. TaxID=1506 RepID=UPI0028FF5544|nr:single-stranded DNA-binding protein [Clostridium sp.]MDU2155367.1 single-stranded DNA-binding protein [Clostridium sp.]
MNKVVLIGRMVADPELNFQANSGMAICRFRLAVTRPFKKDETDFINCIAFNKRAEAIAQYLTKGRQLAVTGSIRTGSYDAKDGTKRYTTDIVVDSFEFIGQGNNNNQGNTSENNFGGMNFEDEMTPDDMGDCPF